MNFLLSIMAFLLIGCSAMEAINSSIVELGDSKEVAQKKMGFTPKHVSNTVNGEIVEYNAGTIFLFEQNRLILKTDTDNSDYTTVSIIALNSLEKKDNTTEKKKKVAYVPLATHGEIAALQFKKAKNIIHQKLADIFQETSISIADYIIAMDATTTSQSRIETWSEPVYNVEQQQSNTNNSYGLYNKTGSYVGSIKQESNPYAINVPKISYAGERQYSKLVTEHTKTVKFFFYTKQKYNSKDKTPNWIVEATNKDSKDNLYTALPSIIYAARAYFEQDSNGPVTLKILSTDPRMK